MGAEYKGALIVATAIAAGLTTLAMGLFANYPFALASGMGLNAFVAFGLILGMKLSWQTAMTIVFIEGLIVFLLVLTKTREAVMNAIPTNLKRGIGVGIGLFLGFIGLKGAGIVVADPATFVNFGDITRGLIVSAIGLLITALLMARKIKGSILIGIIVTTLSPGFPTCSSVDRRWSSSPRISVRSSRCRRPITSRPSSSSISPARFKVGLIGVILALHGHRLL